MLENKIEREILYLEKEISQIKAQLSSLPPGRISFCPNGKYEKWIHVIDKHKMIIKKSDYQLAYDLSLKEKLTQKLNELEADYKYLLRYNPPKIKITKEAITRSNGINKIMSQTNTSTPISSWANEPFRHNESYPEQLRYPGISGRKFRSKSEVMIDEILFLNNIEYRYECELVLDDLVFFPDFTIYSPQNNTIKIWEHFGMMDNPSYAQNAFHKLNVYINNGYIPGYNLITTFETSQCPLDIKYVNSIVENCL